MHHELGGRDLRRLRDYAMADEEDDASNQSLNFSEDLEDLKVIGSGVVAVDVDAVIGILTLQTQVGKYDYLIDQAVANIVVQQLREYIRGESDKLQDI
jgi:hypothetical protein